MTTTATYAVNPSAADITLSAFGMLQIRRHDLTSGHLEDAAFQANMLMGDISNRNPNRWMQETVLVPLLLATSNYELPARTISITTAIVTRTGYGDLTLGPISAADYTGIPQKTTAGTPSAFWFALTSTPSITVWPVPDAAVVAASGSLSLMTFRQAQDVDLSGGYSVDSPYRFLDAFSTGLAARLAQYYRPEMEAKLNDRFEQRFARAQKRDQENVAMSITPNLSGYFR